MNSDTSGPHPCQVKLRPWRFFTTGEAAAVLRIHRNTVIHLFAEGKLRALRVGPRGGQWRIERVSLEAYIRDGLEETRRETSWSPERAQGRRS